MTPLHDPVIQTYDQYMLAEGKPKMIAVTASMQKLLVILNTMVANNEKWNPKNT